MNDRIDAEKQFWSLATLTASMASDRHRAYRNLQAQYRATRPDANHLEHEAAMTRLAKLLRV